MLSTLKLLRKEVPDEIIMNYPLPYVRGLVKAQIAIREEMEQLTKAEARKRGIKEEDIIHDPNGDLEDFFEE